MWNHAHRADVQVQVCRVPEYLFPPHSFLFLPPVSWDGERLGSCLVMALPLYSFLWAFPFFRRCRWSILQSSVHFQFSCICYSCFFSVFVGGGFCLAFPRCHLFSQNSSAIAFYNFLSLLKILRYIWHGILVSGVQHSYTIICFMRYSPQ